MPGTHPNTALPTSRVQYGFLFGFRGCKFTKQDPVNNIRWQLPGEPTGLGELTGASHMVINSYLKSDLQAICFPVAINSFLMW